MIERTIGMQATIKQAELLAWASDERRAAEAEQPMQVRQMQAYSALRVTIARTLVALAMWLSPGSTVERLTVAE
jgi:hypothetical protein